MKATFYPIGGFLGAGKTTTLLAAAAALRARGRRPAVVTNDQGRELVDTRLARDSSNADVAEVLDGCFCCRFDELVAAVRALINGGSDAILAEAVGSCTDLRATVVRPLRQHYGDQLRVAPLVTVVDPDRYRLFVRAWDSGADSDLAYLYHHQLSEADVIAINKVDTVPPGRLDPLRADVTARYPGASVVTYSARSGDTAGLLDTEPVPDHAQRFDLDYDRYAAAEAELAWLNHSVTITSKNGFLPVDWAGAALRSLSTRFAESGAVVGHAKLTVDSAAGLTKASVVRSGQPPQIDLAASQLVTSARALLNLRVACSPDVLNAACTDAVAVADEVCDTRGVPDASPAAFRPAYPRPTHRVPRPT